MPHAGGCTEKKGMAVRGEWNQYVQEEQDVPSILSAVSNDWNISGSKMRVELQGLEAYISNIQGGSNSVVE